MTDLSTFSPVVLARLTPFKGHLEDVKREFAALAQSVWDDETTTRYGDPMSLASEDPTHEDMHGRCYYWLYPEDDPSTINVIEIYDGEAAIDVHACGDLTCKRYSSSPATSNLNLSRSSDSLTVCQSTRSSACINTVCASISKA